MGESPYDGINASHSFVQITLSWPCLDMPVWSVKNVVRKCQPVNKECHILKAGTDLKICPLSAKCHNKGKIHGDGAGF